MGRPPRSPLSMKVVEARGGDRAAPAEGEGPDHLRVGQVVLVVAGPEPARAGGGLAAEPLGASRARRGRKPGC